MTRNAKGNLRYRARTTTATIALVAGGYLVMSATTAEPAAGQSSSEAGKGGWLTQVWSGASPADPAKNQADAQYVGAPKKKTADVDGKEDLFRPGPQYDKNYDAQGNVDIYGAKSVIDPPRPPIELGRQQYTSGQYDPSSTILGELNPLLPGLAIYGDWRTAVAYNGNNGKDIAQIATRLNVDVDFKFTGTERIHAFFTPFQKNNKFTRYEFGGGDGDGKFNGEFDLRPQTLFFEGDFGSIYSGFSGYCSQFRPALHCRSLPAVPAERDLGERRDPRRRGEPHREELARSWACPTTTSPSSPGPTMSTTRASSERAQQSANIYGVTTFIDAFGGYIEAGYGLIQGRDENEGLLTNFLTAAYSRRYFNTVSNSTRVFANFGNGKNDEGFAIISENSLITSLPSTLIPYANFFIGFDNPQPLVDGNGAGILKNVGINFETDALTGYPKLNDTGSNAWGGAIGLQYLFNLDQQLVFEVATVQPFGDPIPGIGVAKPQYGFGVRYQVPLTLAWLLRADATYQIIEGGAQDNFGVRVELRRKF